MLHTFHFVVTDTERPTFTSNISSLTAIASAGLAYVAVSWTEPVVTDNSGFLTVSSNYQPGDQFPIGETNVTYTATDSSGNINTFSFTVTVSVGGKCFQESDFLRRTA